MGRNRFLVCGALLGLLGALSPADAQYVAVDLTPAGSRAARAVPVGIHPYASRESQAYGTSGGRHVGAGMIQVVTVDPPAVYDQRHALLWIGTADMVVDLHPAGFAETAAVGVSGAQQVG